MKLLARLLGESIETQLDIGDRVYPIVADPAQLEAALTNLATNARDAMPRGGKLLISTANRTLDAEYAAQNRDVVPGDYALIEVTDTGVGMTPEVMGHIFEPFFTTKERDKGTGLGLSMVFGFIKQSGGHISVYSEVGVGTTFRLYFARSDEGGKVEVAPQQPDVSSSKGELVLVVEDNVALRRVAVRQIRDLGYRVIDVGSAAEAMAKLEDNEVDVLFTDVVMPGGVDGFELATLAVSRRPRLKVVLTSGYPEGKIREGLADAEFLLLSKPYRRAALGQTLREALDADSG